MRAIKNVELFERKKEEFKKYIINHKMPTKVRDSYFEDGASMWNFFYSNRKELLKDAEIQKIIEDKIKEEQEKFSLAEQKIKKQELDTLKELKEFPNNFEKLNEIEKLIFYRECFLTPEENKESYTIENITITKEQLKFFKKLYHNCYATYLEKEKIKGKNPITEKLDKKEIERLEYLNTICIKTNWNKDKINELAKIYNCAPEDIKNSVIKYNYLTLYPEITEIHSERQKPNCPTEFQTHQLNATTIKEIENIYNPIQIKEYLDYQKSNGYSWKHLKNIQGFPAEEIIKMIYNIQTKSNLFKRNLETKRIERKVQKSNEFKKTKIEIAEQEINAILEIIKNQTFTSITEFYKINNITQENFRKTMRLLKENNNELYQKAENALQEKISEKITPTEEILNLLNSLKEHIENNKEFTIIDYQSITNISLTEMKKRLNNLDLSNEDKRIIQTFVSKTLGSRPLKIKQILSIKTTLQDKDGNLITPSTEEIENIIKFMEENNIPLLTKPYNSILKLYINGELPIIQTKNRKNLM